MRDVITVENTKFIFATNFSGDPKRDKYGNDARVGNLILNDPRIIDELIRAGFNVRQTQPKPDDDDFEPTYFVKIRANYDSKYPPRIFLVSGDAEPVRLDEETVSEIDKCYVLNVNVILNPYINKNTGSKSLYIRTMYVEQDVESDPFASRYTRRGRQFSPGDYEAPEEGVGAHLPF